MTLQANLIHSSKTDGPTILNFQTFLGSRRIRLVVLATINSSALDSITENFTLRPAARLSLRIKSANFLLTSCHRSGRLAYLLVDAVRISSHGILTKSA